MKPESRNKSLTLAVRRKPGGLAHQGLIHVSGDTFACSLGRTGISTRKREGDGATPPGRWRLLYGFYRADRLNRPRSLLPFAPITGSLGWCDDPAHPAYNGPVALPFAHSHEKMMRADQLYDVCIVLDYNLSPKARGLGSAIFLHLTRPDGGPTEGCIAIEPDRMRRLLPRLNSDCLVEVTA